VTALLDIAPVAGPLAYVVVGVVVVAGLPTFGRRVLAFLRDLDDFREQRKRRS